MLSIFIPIPIHWGKLVNPYEFEELSTLPRKHDTLLQYKQTQKYIDIDIDTQTQTQTQAQAQAQAQTQTQTQTQTYIYIDIDIDIRYGTVRYDTTRHNTTQHNAIQYTTLHYNTIQYNTYKHADIQAYRQTDTHSHTQTPTSRSKPCSQSDATSQPAHPPPQVWLHDAQHDVFSNTCSRLIGMPHSICNPKNYNQVIFSINLYQKHKPFQYNNDIENDFLRGLYINFMSLFCHSVTSTLSRNQGPGDALGYSTIKKSLTADILNIY